MNISDLPTLNAILNSISAVCLLLGYLQIRRGNRTRHKHFMLAALSVSALFLISYITYHLEIGSVPYPHHDWTRPLYFAILIPHVTLAVLMAPFVVALVRYALLGKFAKHKKLTRIIWPVWMFVSLSGVAVYAMLYLQAAPPI